MMKRGRGKKVGRKVGGIVTEEKRSKKK